MLASTTSSISILPEIATLDFTSIKHKLLVSEELGVWTTELCDLAEREYKRYLTLIKLNQGLEIVPSKLMDQFWHQHILDTVAYANDCQRIFGFFLHHFPYFGIYGKKDQEALQTSFQKTKELYLEMFGEPMENPTASRCQDHACHVESECACRVSGACKNHHNK